MFDVFLIFEFVGELEFLTLVADFGLPNGLSSVLWFTFSLSFSWVSNFLVNKYECVFTGPGIWWARGKFRFIPTGGGVVAHGHSLAIESEGPRVGPGYRKNAS